MTFRVRSVNGLSYEVHLGTPTMLSRRCLHCDEPYAVSIRDTDEFMYRFAQWTRGVPFQEAFPGMHKVDQKFIQYGVCETCWKKTMECL